MNFRALYRCVQQCFSRPQQWVIEWDAGYGIFYWVGDCEVAWGKITPSDGDIFKAVIYPSRELAENDLPRAQWSRHNARVVQIKTTAP